MAAKSRQELRRSVLTRPLCTPTVPEVGPDFSAAAHVGNRRYGSLRSPFLSPRGAVVHVEKDDRSQLLAERPEQPVALWEAPALRPAELGRIAVELVVGVVRIAGDDVPGEFTHGEEQLDVRVTPVLLLGPARTTTSPRTAPRRRRRWHSRELRGHW
jgi:hypothetical protein